MDYFYVHEGIVDDTCQASYWAKYDFDDISDPSQVESGSSFTTAFHLENVQQNPDGLAKCKLEYFSEIVFFSVFMAI